MGDGNGKSEVLVAAERRRVICEMVKQRGFVNVVGLVEALGAGEKTIRNDLDRLAKEGKVERVHGGAVARKTAVPRPPYTETRGANMREKALIAEAALNYVPTSGNVYFGSGSTVLELADRIQPGRTIRAFAQSFDTAARLVSLGIPVDVPAGSVIPNSLGIDMSLSEELIDRLYWDVGFMGVGAIDIVRGITTVEPRMMSIERKLFEHTGRSIVLCDSSKLGRFAYAQVGPLSLMDVLITDSGIDQEFVDELVFQGVEVVVARPEGGDVEVFTPETSENK